MDASQYKDYVLVLLVVKYISDKASSRKDYLLTVPKGGSLASVFDWHKTYRHSPRAVAPLPGKRLCQ